MVNYDNTNLDQIAELLDKCVENLRKVFEPLRIGPYFPHREEFITDLLQIKKALSIYKSFDLHKSAENLNDRQLFKNFEKEILYNLSSFTGRQETYYHVIVRKLLVKVRSVREEVIKYDQTCNIIHNIAISNSVWGADAATLYDNLERYIEEVLGATSTLHHILQPYLIPYYDEDFKVAIEGKGSTDYFAPSLLPSPTVQQPEPTEPEPAEPGAKLTWNCKPAIAGFIISELIRAGYIDPPVRRGDLNLKELARTCNQIFDFKDFKPGVDGWRNNVDETRNELTAVPRAKLKLPERDQLS